MATVNKDFKIKSGLIVEGTNGTINGFNILTESQDSIDFIVDVIGGETLITSVESTQLEVISGELNVKAEVFDDFGSADAAQTAAETFATNADTTLYGTVTTDIATAKSEAGVIAQGYADTAESEAIAAAALDATSKADAAEDSAVTTANAYTDQRETAITTAYQIYANTAEQDAKDYADALINDASTSSSEVWSAYKTSTEIGVAQAAAELHADEAVAALVGSAPAVLDTIQELATALENNPDIIADLENVAAGKQNTLIEGANIDISADIISVTGLDTDDVSEGSNLYFTNSRAIDATSSSYEPSGSVSMHATTTSTHGVSGDIVGTSDSQTLTNKTIDGSSNTLSNIGNASLSNSSITVNGYSTDLGSSVTLDTDDVAEGSNEYFTTTRAQIAAAQLLLDATKTNIDITGTYMGLTITAENGVADSTTDELEEGESNLYFTDARAQGAINDTTPNFAAIEIDLIAKQVAASTDATTAGIQVGYAFAKADYRSAEFLVKVAYGTHTEISKVLLTLDTSDNIAITEYGIVGTNGSASSISADISGTDVRLLVTTTNNNSTVVVMGTLLV